MTTISRPPHIYPNSGPINRHDSGPLAPLSDMPVYQPIPVMPDLTTRPIPAPPPPTWPLFEALRIGSATRRPFTIATTEHEAWLTYDPIARWVTGSCVVNPQFWHAMAREAGACHEGAHELVLGTMLRLFPLLAEAQWTVTPA